MCRDLAGKEEGGVWPTKGCMALSGVPVRALVPLPTRCGVKGRVRLSYVNREGTNLTQ